MKVLFIHTHYEEFLADLYASDPEIEKMDYERQLRRIFASGFGTGDAHSHALRGHGFDTHDIITNADTLQTTWARENGISASDDRRDRRREIVAAQIDQLCPDVAVVFEWCPLGDDFLQEIKARIRLVVGEIASPLPPDRTFAAYDLMLSCLPPIVEHFRRKGTDTLPLKLAFDSRIEKRLGGAPARHDVTFVGGFGQTHADRITWLERLLQDLDITIYGYGLDRVSPESAIRRHHRGPAWGMKMYDILQRSKITLNLHTNFELDGHLVTNIAANMRLYEATGVGTCLVTEHTKNLSEIFAPGRQVATYTDFDDCAAVVMGLLADETRRQEIAKAGQARTLGEHTYEQRMREFGDILSARI